MAACSVMVLLAHPRAESFNHAIAERVVAALAEHGITVNLHDLYDEGFDPVLRAAEAYTSGQSAREVASASADPLIVEHRRQLAEANGIVAIHPNWWGKPPAIMAGWLDRVLIPGVAYQLHDRGAAPVPLLSVRALLVVNTSDTAAEREQAMFGDPLDAIWRRCLPPYLGQPVVDRLVFRVVGQSSPDERQRWLHTVGKRSTAFARLVCANPSPEASSTPTSRLRQSVL